MFSQLELQEVPLDEAIERWGNELDFRNIRSADNEEVPVLQAAGRTTSQPVTARISSPHFYSAAVDGLAVKATLTFPATPETPVRIRLGQDATFVDTNSPLPEGTDAVVAIADLQFVSAEELEIRTPAAPWQNVRPTGEDVAAHEIIVPAGHRIRPIEVGAMLAGGVTRVSVKKQPSVAIVPIGTGLVRAGSSLLVGQSIESNSQILHALVEEWGGRPMIMEIVPEKRESVAQALVEAALHHDAVVVVAGVSQGTQLVARALQEQGDLIVYGVAIKPGSSTCLGLLEGKPVLGMPGYGVSAYVAFELFGRPLLGRLLGSRPPRRVRVSATLARDVTSPQGIEEFLRVNLGLVNGRRIALPISRGAAGLMTLVRAHGLVRVPATVEQIGAGTSVEVELMDSSATFENNLLAIGTYDIIFDVLRNHLLRQYPDLAFYSANVGSARGLASLALGLSHISGQHLFDEATGEYNTPFAARLSDEGCPLVLVNLFSRHLCLIVAAGNPKNIQGFADLARPDVTFINRQIGSGTRMLIDYHLKKHGVESSQVRGYERETYTHMSLASTIASGSADVGVGLPAVARSLGLESIPAIPERFDLAIPRRLLNSHLVQALISVIRGDAFQAEVSALQGYDTSLTGQVVYGSER